MNESQIREAVERALAACPGTLYGASAKVARNANGNDAFNELARLAEQDLDAASHTEGSGHGPAR